MTQIGRHHPVQIAFRAPQTGCRQNLRIAVRRTAPFQKRLFKILHRSRQNQLFLCTRQRHIKHAQLLCKVFLSDCLCQRTLCQCAVGNPFFDIRIIHTAAPFLVQQHRTADIQLIKAFPHIRHENHRKFQTLALVNRHHLHPILALGRQLCGRCFRLRRFHILHIADEIKQSPMAALLVLLRLFQQKPQIRLPERPPCRHTQIIIIPRFAVQQPQQLMQRKIPHLVPPMC